MKEHDSARIYLGNLIPFKRRRVVSETFSTIKELIDLCVKVNFPVNKKPKNQLREEF